MYERKLNILTFLLENDDIFAKCGAKVLIFCNVRKPPLSYSDIFNKFYPNKLNKLLSLLYFCIPNETSC